MAKIFKRLKDDFKTIGLVKNWQQFLTDKLKNRVSDEIVLRNGITMTAPPQTDLNFLFQEIWIEKTYNPKGYEIAPFETIVDIGANIGVFALYAAQAAPGTQIYAFEPFPENLTYLDRNIAESRVKNIKVEGKAVARRAEPRALKITPSGITHELSDDNDSENVVVNCTTINDILEKIEKCDLLKIDCEGSEYEILYSCAPENLKKIRRIVGEYHYRNDAERNGGALKDFLKKNSYTVDHFVPFDEKVGLICAVRNN